MRRGLRVLTSGPQLLVQDLGRRGQAHLGVSPSGALDPDALALANRLVGNDPSAAGLEVLLGGVRLEATDSVRVAVTGAPLPVAVDGHARAWGEAVSVRAGQRLDLGTMRTGLRCWLAVSGGVRVRPVLGSRATDTLSGLGPDPLRDGDLVPVGPAGSADPGEGTAVPVQPGSQPVPLRMRLGPRQDWLLPGALDLLGKDEYVVSGDSDRVGVRLEHHAGRPLERARREELPSEGLVTGAVQVPANGQPLVFLADHPVTGGYPVVGVVEPADLAVVAQLRPGTRIRFRPYP